MMNETCYTSTLTVVNMVNANSSDADHFVFLGTIYCYAYDLFIQL